MAQRKTSRRPVETKRPAANMFTKLGIERID